MLTRTLCMGLAVACLAAPAAAKRSVAQKKRMARSEFEQAERMQEALNGRPEAQRRQKDYDRVIEAFRKVYHTAPTSSKADASVEAVAELMVAEGRQLQDDKIFKDAIGQYEFLRREYPGSKYRFEALFTMAEVYHDDLGDNAKAKETFEEFVKRYPRHELAEQARAALREIQAEEKSPHKKRTQLAKSAKGKKAAGEDGAGDEDESRAAAAGKDLTGKGAARGKKAKEATADLPVEAAADDASASGAPEAASDTRKGKTVAAKSADADEAPVMTTGARRGKLPLLTSVRYWSTPDYTRVAIDLEQEVKYEAGRVPSPDRIFFDLHDTKLASELVGKSFEVGDGFLRKIRVAQFTPNLARVVLEVDSLAEYSAFLLPNPYRLIIDIHGKQPAATMTASSSGAASGATGKVLEPSRRPEQPTASAPSADRIESADKNVRAAAKNAEREAAKESARKAADRGAPTDESTEAKTTAAARSHAPASDQSSADDTASAQVDATKELTEVATAREPEVTNKEVKSTERPTSAPTVDKVAPRETKSSRQSSKRQKKDREALAAATREAQPTAEGDRSLIRALGLKIGRIVVDAGHGGHDTGTIGPNGLLEKDLVLDVALRLGKLLEQKLGAEVIYTRDDDTFIPLETRTAIANKHQADLFISVHANSSHDPAARGVETYYLNFTSNADALEVAARENAVSEKSVFELSDLVKKIAMKEKIEESREFASDVQKALHTGLVAKAPGLKDRGVKKAPFVVLIGANMPSILAEISFVSNPQDERRLKTPEYRQRIAESLFRGVSHYASGLAGVKVASKAEDPNGQ